MSAGVAAEATLARQLRLEEGEPAWDRLLAGLPSVAEQFVRAQPLLLFVYSRRLPFRLGEAAGPGWVLLPSAAAFVDPLLSTGIPLTLSGIARIGKALENHWGHRSLEGELARCGRMTLFEADTAALLVSALYRSLADFELFAALTLLYFAASSFAEAARRLGRPALAGSFLSGDHPTFGAALRSCCRAVLAGQARGGAGREHLIARIEKAIEPFDIAGFSDRSRRNWHTIEAGPLLSGAPKLRASRAEVEAMLERTGFFGSPGEPNFSALRSGGLSRRASQGEADDLRQSTEFDPGIPSVL